MSKTIAKNLIKRFSFGTDYSILLNMNDFKTTNDINDIKQNFTYHVSVTVNNEIDEEALAQKVASKTMAESKNSIINGFRLAGLE